MNLAGLFVFINQVYKDWSGLLVRLALHRLELHQAQFFGRDTSADVENFDADYFSVGVEIHNDPRMDFFGFDDFRVI